MGFDRYWLLTWTTYGQWLPGDPRGSVTRVRDGSHPTRIEHDEFQTPVEPSLPGLYASARKLLKCAPVRLESAQATVLLEQFRQTAAHRDWELYAVAILSNHVHVVLGVPGDPDPAYLLRDLKSYGSRALNRRWSTPASGTWWTASGSRRKLPSEAAVRAAIEYVRTQAYPLLIHSSANSEG